MSVPTQEQLKKIMDFDDYFKYCKNTKCMDCYFLDPLSKEGLIICSDSTTDAFYKLKIEKLKETLVLKTNTIKNYDRIFGYYLNKLVDLQISLEKENKDNLS